MKMRKRIAALIAVAMIASLMPMTAFAASRNDVTKVVTVEKDATIKKDVDVVPFQKIDVRDAIPTNQSFYLDLEGAEWASVADLVDVFNMKAANSAVKKSDDIFEFKVGTALFEGHKEKDTSIAVRLMDNGGTDFKGLIEFPLLAKVTDSEAFVLVDKFDTEISDSRTLFAVSDAAKVKVTIGDAPKFYRTGKIATITLDELYANSLKDVADSERWFTLELRDTDFRFASVPSGAKISGTRAYRRAVDQVLVEDDSYRISKDGSRLGIRIDKSLFAGAAYERGVLEISGIEIVADRDARNGEVKAILDSKELFDKETIVVATRGDYKTKLAASEDYKVVAGNLKEVEFTLSEELANSLIGTRPVTFTFDNDVEIVSAGSDDSTKNWEDYKADRILWDGLTSSEADTARDLIAAIEALEKLVSLTAAERIELASLNAKLNRILVGNTVTTTPGYTRPGSPQRTGYGLIKVNGSDVAAQDKDDWGETALKTRVHVANDGKSFTVENFNTNPKKAGEYTFKVTLRVPAKVTGDVMVAATGKGIEEDEVKILEVEAPVTVETKGIDIKVGLKEIETTGKITIKETDKERLAQGKDIVLRIDDIDKGLKIKSFDYKVVEGDLVLEDAYGKWNAGDEAVGVKRVSTEASTIEITNIVMYTDRTVPEGKYDLLVGGDAITRLGGFDKVVKVKDFVNITTKNTEDIAASANKNKVAFVVGSDKYMVNDVEQDMDAAPYIKDGRTMVPVRYVALALGVEPEQVIWDQANQTATVIADKIIQVKLGSNMMLVNGVTFPMDAAAELTADRTFVPVAEIARALGVPVAWDAGISTATFN